VICLADKLRCETSKCMVHRRPQHRMLYARKGTPTTHQTPPQPTLLHQVIRITTLSRARARETNRSRRPLRRPSTQEILDPWRMCFPDPAEGGWTGIVDPIEEQNNNPSRHVRSHWSWSCEQQNAANARRKLCLCNVDSSSQESFAVRA
jgi:hypothetical protein